MINSQRTGELAQRQRALLMRSAELRLRFIADVQVLAKPLRAVDRVQAAWLWLYAHPAVPAALLATLAVLRPRRALRWGLRLWWGWQTFRRLASAAERLR